MIEYPQDDPEISQIWATINHDIPESFWDVAIWQPGSSWVTGSLDVAARRKIGCRMIAEMMERSSRVKQGM